MGYLISFIVVVAELLSALIIFRALLSWFPISREGTFYQIIYSATEPILSPLRNLIPPVGGMDLSPMVAIVVLQVIEMLFSSLA